MTEEEWQVHNKVATAKARCIDALSRLQHAREWALKSIEELEEAQEAEREVFGECLYDIKKLIAEELR